VEIEFASKKQAKLANSFAKLNKEYGNRAKKISRLLQWLSAATTLTHFRQLAPLVRLHQLTENRDEQFAVDVTKNYRMTFVVNNEPVPRKADGGLEIDAVTAIQIVNLCEDYHG